MDANKQKQRGQAIGEFALIIPLLFVMIVALLDFGRIVYVNNALAEGAREGARWGAVQGRAATTAGLTSVADETKARMTAVPNPSVTVSCDRLITTTPNCSTGDIIEVTATSVVSPMTPIIGQFIGPVTLTSTAKMSIHQ
ncbi:MAG: TadE/TadG family type IV pilus assembly protein [Chloroflexota bacterium]|jgi:Flp pilus assembly protein TadG